MSKRWKAGGRPAAGVGCGARPWQARRLLKLRESAHTAWAGGIVLAATLVLRTWGAPHTGGSLAAAGTESSCAAEGMMGLTALSRDWMFAPCLDGCLARWAGNGLAEADRRRRSAGCTLGTSLNAPIEAEDRSSSLESRKTRSWRACIPVQRGTAQQMLDLTAGTPVVVLRPLAVEDDLGEDATRGWR